MTELKHDDANNWATYRRLVLQEIERLDKSIKVYQNNHKDEIDNIREIINNLKLTTIQQLGDLRSVIENSHNKDYDLLEQRIRKTENKVINIYGMSAGISFGIGLIVSLVTLLINIMR